MTLDGKIGVRSLPDGRITNKNADDRPKTAQELQAKCL